MADSDETLARLGSDHSDEASGIFATVHIFNHVLNRLLSKDTHIPGITGVNSRIILYVAHQEKLGKPVYQSDVKAHFGITRSTCSRVLGLMESKGLIQRTRPEADGRKSELHLTDSSRRSVSHIMESARKIEERVLQGVDPRDLEVSCKVFNLMMDNIARMEEDQEGSGVSVDPETRRRPAGSRS